MWTRWSHASGKSKLIYEPFEKSVLFLRPVNSEGRFHARKCHITSFLNNKQMLAMGLNSAGTLACREFGKIMNVVNVQLGHFI